MSEAPQSVTLLCDACGDPVGYVGCVGPRPDPWDTAPDTPHHDILCYRCWRRLCDPSQDIAEDHE